MADQKISALTALAGANVTTSTDLLAIVDTSAGATKSILVDEFRISLSATQALQEATTNSSTFVMPSIQQYHPSAAKAWGLITTPTTVSASYPGSGVSVTSGGTGVYTVTHGQTFSSANYSVLVTAFYDSAAQPISVRTNSFTVSTFIVNFETFTGTVAVDFGTISAISPVKFSYACYGDL